MTRILIPRIYSCFNMFKDKRDWREKHVDGDNMLTGEITIEDRILTSRHSH
jgi:hypothetical protein